MTAPTMEEVAMNPADRVREAARSAVVQFTALLEYLDHIAKGRDGSPHVDAEDRSALDALRSALALPVEALTRDRDAATEALVETLTRYGHATHDERFVYRDRGVFSIVLPGVNIVSFATAPEAISALLALGDAGGESKAT